MILKQLQLGPMGTNCYLLGDEASGRCFAVDPGYDSQRVLQLADQCGLSIQAVLLTHGHYDHVGGVAGLLDRWPDLPVYLHQADLYTPGGDREFQYVGAGPTQRTYGEGDVLPLGGTAVRVLHTPGHSPGSVVLLWEGVMLSGDTLFAGSCGRWDLFAGSMHDMFASLKRLGQLEGDYQVCPGHGPGTTLETERRTNPYLRRAMEQ